MATPTVLSLFSGVAGIDLGLKKAGFETVCCVENDPYAVRVLQARMDGGQMDEAPIWDDARTFDGKEWRDEIDLIAGGFPCQDVSTAGKRAGIGGARSGLWAEMHRTVREVRPRFVLCENVPGLLSSGMGRVLGDLASLRYDAIWTVLSAAEVGAPHLRRRVFIVAHPHEDGRDGAGLPDFAWEEGALLAGGGEGEERLMLPTPSATPYGSNRGGAGGRVGKERPSLETMVRKDMWPTPGAGDAQKVGLNPAMMKRVQARLDGSIPCAPSGANYQESLPERVALVEARFWRTPGASDGEGGVMEMRPDADGHYKLRDQVQEANREFWPTPRTTDSHGQGEHGQGGIDLRTAVKMFPTPRAQDSYERSNWKTVKEANEGGKAQMTLTRKVKYEARMFPTPCAADAEKYGRGDLYAKINDSGRQRRWPTASATDWKLSCKPGQRRGQLSEVAASGGGQLNPAWVEWLVGVPVGWTDLKCASPEYPEGLSFGDAWAYDPHPAVPRVAKGVPDRAKRLRCLGNIVVPQCAYSIGAWIMEVIAHG